MLGSVPLSPDWLLIVPGTSPLAAPSQLSLHALLGDVERAIRQHRLACNPFDDWFKRALIIDQDATVASRELYVSYNKFVQAARLHSTEHLTQTALGRLLTAQGLTRYKGGDGRIYRRGVCLLDPSHNMWDRQLQTLEAGSGGDAPDASASGVRIRSVDGEAGL